MGQLKINQERVSADVAEALIGLCPFGAISHNGTELEISAACKMCRLCVKKGPAGAIEYIEETKSAVDKSAWKGICVYIDHTGGEIHHVSYELIGKAKELAAITGHPVYGLMIGSNITKSAKRLLHYGADRIYVYDDLAFADFRIEPYTAAFCDFIDREKPSSILIGATDLGRQLAPRVAARCRAGLTADCILLAMKANTDLVQIRPAFGGNIMAQIVSPNHRPQFCTVRYKVFDEPTPSDEEHGEIISMPVAPALTASRIQVLETTEKPKDIDISETDVIVAIGRGACSDALIASAKELADALGGMLACTRPLVETNRMDHTRQIGLSGRTVKPKLILCLGISGSVQFSVGIKSSGCIVAVNSDKDAPIFDVAHYGIVGDVAEILPRLLAKVKEAQNHV